MSNATPNCARCPYKILDRLCREENGKSPVFCPMQNMPELISQSLKEYSNTLEIREFARQKAATICNMWWNIFLSILLGLTAVIAIPLVCGSIRWQFQYIIQGNTRHETHR